MENGLDPRVQKINTIAKTGGVAIVAVAASAVVIVAGSSLVVAGAVGLVGLFMVNYAVPVGARRIALMRQKALTDLAEEFSEETIRKDELEEDQRIKVLQDKYVKASARIENASQNLRKQLDRAKDDEKKIIEQRLQQLKETILLMENEIRNRKAIFEEMKRVNEMEIAMNQASDAIIEASGQTRTAQQDQDIRTARNAIKNRWNEAIATSTINKINASFGGELEGGKA